ncbi:hypothetical protein [Nonomuraea ferruginea]|uniref:Uncharacterized protein n=1 Tax=Nonomuraea ferruginea TaxID=46174 RepID=A0ABT4T740_9ACTN|nr:hypothetical protein [Nonomuraea ferruginea]MDA0645328.1 hypothetical protein [Nonomuraea ferruginea]
MSRRTLDTSGRPGVTVHGAKLPTYYQPEAGRDGWLEADRKRGMSRSGRPTRERRPRTAERKDTR